MVDLGISQRGGYELCQLRITTLLFTYMCWLLYKELKNIIIIRKQNFRQKGALWIRSSIDRFMKFIFTNMYNYNSRLKVKAII